MKQTDSGQRGGRRGDGVKQGERISQRTYMTHRHRQQCGDVKGGGGLKTAF